MYFLILACLLIDRCRPTRALKTAGWVGFCLSLQLDCAAPNFTDEAYYRDRHKDPVGSLRAEEIRHRLILIGDAGYGGARQDSSLALLRRVARVAPSVTTVIFLEDNIYPAGLPAHADSDSARGVAQLDAQWKALPHRTRDAGPYGTFIQGNHDWGNAQSDGQQRAIRQYDHLNRQPFGSPNYPRIVPRGGCPGPEKLDLPFGSDIRVIAVDTQWWLHSPDWLERNRCFSVTDEEDYEEEFLRRFDEFLRTAGDRDIVVVGHHPLQSHGPHGGYELAAPIIGPIYNWLRRRYASDQDLTGRRNKRMTEKLSAVMEPYKPLVYASGHEHNLQVLNGGGTAEYLLVSGSGSKLSNVTKGDDTYFAHAHTGLMIVDFISERRIALRVYEAGADRPVYSKWLRE